MNRRLLILSSVLLSALTLFACSTSPHGPGWISLVDDDKGLENWNKLGDANWRAENNAIIADKGAGGFLVSKKMQRMGYKPIGFVATEYALAIWSMNEVEDINILLNEDIMLDDLYEWLEETPLLKKNFRDAAIISGLIERKIPGQVKTGKQVIFNSDLIFNVLKKHEPNHILLQVARDDAYRGLIDLDRLSEFLKRIKNKII